MYAKSSRCARHCARAEIVRVMVWMHTECERLDATSLSISNKYSFSFSSPNFNIMMPNAVVPLQFQRHAHHPGELGRRILDSRVYRTLGSWYVMVLFIETTPRTHCWGLNYLAFVLPELSSLGRMPSRLHFYSSQFARTRAFHFVLT